MFYITKGGCINYKTINGWTKELMKAQIRKTMTIKSSNGVSCKYRAIVKGRETTCAVGCFIPKLMYNPLLEKTLPYDRTFGELTRYVRFPLSNVHLREMQKRHDRSRAVNPAEEVCAWIDANVEDGE